MTDLEIQRLAARMWEDNFNVAESRCRRAEAIASAALEALRLVRSLVKEGGVPRYTVDPGAALNCCIEEVVDPILKFHPAPVPA